MTAPSIRVAVLNVRSLRYKLSELQDLMAAENLDIIGICETWLDPTISDGELQIPGYSMARQDRAGGGYGGTCVYYRSALPIKNRSDLHAGDIEATWIEIKSGATPHLFACVYRPPDERIEYWTRLEAALHTAGTYSQNLTVVGDFNVNADPAAPSQQLHYLYDLGYGYGLQNVNTRATRVTPQCPRGTVLDLILTSPDSLRSCSVVECTISDHFAVTAALDLKVPQHGGTAEHPSRKVHRIDIAAFRADIAAADLGVFPPESTVDDMWEHWHNGFLTVLDRHAPMMQGQKRRRTTPPWSDRELYQLQVRKSRLHRRWLLNKGDAALYAQFKLARSDASRAYRRKRNAFFSQQCQDSQQNPRKMWSLVNTMTGRAKPNQAPTCSLDDISNAFHAVVTDQSRPTSIAVPCGPHPPAAIECFHCQDVRAVANLLRQVNPQKATGSDGIPGLLLKACADLLAHSLWQIFHKSTTTGTVPAAFKVALVRPLFKAGDPSEPSNYRPVSLLPIVSKLLEKIVQRQLSDFVHTNSVIPESQYAFRAKRSTEQALVCLTDGLIAAKDQKLHTGACFLDMSKAFDKVRHHILVHDLFNIGVTGKALAWVISYLTGRQQYVQFGAQQSACRSCSCGVPQGSVLGPLLFSIYTRAVPSVIEPAQSIQFADDIEVQFSHASVPEISETLTAAVTRLSTWLRSRGLVLNEKKSHLLKVYAGRHPPMDEITVHCHQTALPVSSRVKYLGVLVDDGLTFRDHTDQVATRMAQKLGALWRARRCLSQHARAQYVLAVIMPDMLYASSCFSASLSAAQVTRLQTLQNRAARTVFGAPQRESAHPLLVRLGVFRVAECFHQRTLALTWKGLHGEASPAISQLFQHQAARHTRLQESDGLVLPVARTAAGKGRFAFSAASKWNLLPAEVRSAGALKEFQAAAVPYTLA